MGSQEVGELEEVGWVTEVIMRLLLFTVAWFTVMVKMLGVEMDSLADEVLSIKLGAVHEAVGISSLRVSTLSHLPPILTTEVVVAEVEPEDEVLHQEDEVKVRHQLQTLKWGDIVQTCLE